MIPSTTEFQVWREDLRTGEKTHKPNTDYHLRTSAEENAKAWNDEEAENARLEMRPVRTRFFVMMATTSYMELDKPHPVHNHDGGHGPGCREGCPANLGAVLGDYPTRSYDDADSVASIEPAGD